MVKGVIANQRSIFWAASFDLVDCTGLTLWPIWKTSFWFGRHVLGPLTTLGPSLTVTDLGDLENTRTQHFFCRHSFVNNKSVYKETPHHSLLIHYNVLQKMESDTLWCLRFEHWHNNLVVTVISLIAPRFLSDLGFRHRPQTCLRSPRTRISRAWESDSSSGENN